MAYLHIIAVFIAIIYILIKKYLDYQEKQPERRRKEWSDKIENAALFELPKVEKVVAMSFLEDSDRLAIAKIDDGYKLFIEVINLNDTTTETIYLEDDISIRPSSLYYYYDFMMAISDKEVETLSSIEDFKFLSEKYFYLNVSMPKQNGHEIYRWNIKIDFKGKTVEKTDDELIKRYQNSQDIGLEFFDITTFKVINLKDFFNDFYRDKDFSSNEFQDKYCYTFLSPDQKKLGLVYFFKDGTMPRGNLSFFDTQYFELPQILFSYDFEGFLPNIKFIKNTNKIGYKYYENEEERLISFVIIELDESKFEDGEKITIECPENYYVRDYELIDKTLIIIGSTEIQFYHIETKENFTIPCNLHTPYCCNDTTFVYMNNYKVEIIDINKIQEMMIF